MVSPSDVNRRFDRADAAAPRGTRHWIAAAAEGIAAAIGRALRAYANGGTEARRMSRLYDALSGMTNGELARLGITRADIPGAVSGTRRWTPPISPSHRAAGDTGRYRLTAPPNARPWSSQ